ncbi:hypothetical protein C0991_008361 [Blastosporella zonata]|nr:hypothetical protein C0991_008361 [Blastosporella zonata]
MPGADAPTKSSLLPSSSRHSNQHSISLNAWAESTTTVVLKGLHLRVQTTYWNLSHDLLSTSLKNSHLCRALIHSYDLGAVIGLIGMLAAIGFLLTTGGTSTVSLARKIWEYTTNISPEPSEILGTLARRGIDASSEQAPTSTSFIKPIIPGVTVPLSHLPIILAAVFLSQIVHEFGHAIAAALESLPILSAGASFTLVVPSAFVTFSNAGLDSLTPRSRARVVAAGPFHNVLLWCMLVLVGHVGLGPMFWSLGYREVSTRGRVVVNVDAQSPLYGYLPVGSMITALDDTPLGSQNTSYDGWSTYLNEDSHDQSLGWCASLPGMSSFHHLFII